MKKPDKIVELKRQLEDVQGWIDKNRAARESAPHYYANVGVAHELRKELLKLRDPALFLRESFNSTLVRLKPFFSLTPTATAVSVSIPRWFDL